MNRIISSLMLLVALMASTPIASAASTVEQADSAYAADRFDEAVRLYSRAAADEGTSSELLYNLANSYYRLGKPGKAILYYERALRLDPSNADARTNLEFVNTKITDEPGDRGMFISNTVNGFACRVSGNVWSGWALTFFILTLGAVALYIFASDVRLRKTGFFGAFVLFALCVVANVFASVSTRYQRGHNQAIIVSPSTLLSTSPRTPKDRSEEAMLLHEGTRVEILDSVTTGTGDKAVKWYDVKVDNANRAWVNGGDIEII